MMGKNRPGLFFSSVSSGKRSLVEIIIIAVLCILLSFYMGKHRVADFMIFCITVLSYDLIYGFMGHLTIGHMLYFGTGTYTAALFMKWVTPNPILGIVAGIVAGALLALIVGKLVIRTKGATFALVNMAFNYVGFFLVAYAWGNVTGGEDGMPSFTGPLGSFYLHRHPYWFFFVLFCLLLSFYLLKHFSASPFGIMVRSIRYSERRVRFLGYNSHYYKLVTFIIASSFAAFAGTLTAINYGYIAPDYISPLRNAEIIFANLIGGIGNIYGALIGGMVYMIIRDFLSIYVERWELVLGVVLVVTALRFRTGITGYIQKYL
jgi:branched-chain amino acid transport system permease protein